MKPSDMKFGARSGKRDDGAELQRWLDAIAGNSGTLDRDYLTGRTLNAHPGTTFYGPGSIGAHPSFDPANVMLNVSSGCRFFDVRFRGNEATREAQPGALMVYVSNAADVVFHGCSFSWWRTLIGMAATNRVQYSRCEFAHWADSRPVEFPGMCLFDGGVALQGSNGSWPNANVDVIDCGFHDGNWTAIDCLAPNEVRWQIVGTTIQRVKECGIYLGVSAAVDRCTIIDVKLRDCSAHCIEGGGIGSSITRSTFAKPDVACLFLTNPVDFYVGGNTILDPMEIAPVDSDPTPWSASIFVRNIPASPDKLSNGLRIEDNVIHCGTGKATHCCSMYDAGGGPFNNATIGPNHKSGHWKGEAVHCDPAAQGQNFHIIGEHHD